MANFELAFKKTLDLEGGYSNDPNDLGGKTKYGITEAVARNYGYKGDMKDFPLEKAKEIYKIGYWNKSRLDEFPSQLLAENVFDCNVNCGPAMGAVFLQRALNSLNINPEGRQVWPDLKVDGQIGNITLDAIKIALQSRKDMESLLIKVFNGLRTYYYVDISEKRRLNKKFMVGWIKYRIWTEVRQ